MKAGSMIAGALLFGLGIAVGFVLDHFTIWTGPELSNWQISLGLLALFWISIPVFLVLMERRGDPHGPEEES